jgi:lipid A 3-O-deacylase
MYRGTILKSRDAIPPPTPPGASRARLAILVLAILATSGPIHADGQEGVRTLSFGTGRFDFNRERNPAWEARLEYRVGRASGPLRGIAVASITSDASSFLGVGIGYALSVGHRLVVMPTFVPGYYRRGDGKDLGWPLEFRSQLELGYRFGGGHYLLISISHVSNARLGHSNPGEETLSVAWQIPLTRRRGAAQ